MTATTPAHPVTDRVREALAISLRGCEELLPQDEWLFPNINTGGVVKFAGDGRIVETGDPWQIVRQPAEAYTRKLLDSVPALGPRQDRAS